MSESVLTNPIVGDEDRFKGRESSEFHSQSFLQAVMSPVRITHFKETSTGGLPPFRHPQSPSRMQTPQIIFTQQSTQVENKDLYREPLHIIGRLPQQSNHLVRSQRIKRQKLDLALRKSKEGQIMPTSYASTRPKTIYSIQDVRLRLQSNQRQSNPVKDYLAYIPPVHFNEFLNNQNYKYFGVSTSRGQGVRTQTSMHLQNANKRFYDDEQQSRMMSHRLVDHVERVICSQNLKRRNIKVMRSFIQPQESAVVKKLQLLQRQ